jgi:hypothetical protein
MRGVGAALAVEIHRRIAPTGGRVLIARLPNSMKNSAYNRCRQTVLELVRPTA